MDEHKEVVKDHYNRHVKDVSTAEVCVCVCVCLGDADELALLSTTCAT